jgi:CubicO group peptidase (beta-lactamase class C family)
MPCDERYRAWAMRQGPADAPPEELHRAFLSRVTGCPARRGFRELHFEAAGTSWSWCFPGPAQAERRNPPVRLLIFRSGAHGLTVQAVTSQAGGPIQTATFDLAAAADLAISGVPVFIHRFFLRQETGQAGPGPRPIDSVRK